MVTKSKSIWTFLPFCSPLLMQFRHSPTSKLVSIRVIMVGYPRIFLRQNGRVLDQMEWFSRRADSLFSLLPEATTRGTMPSPLVVRSIKLHGVHLHIQSPNIPNRTRLRGMDDHTRSADERIKSIRGRIKRNDSPSSHRRNWWEEGNEEKWCQYNTPRISQ